MRKMMHPLTYQILHFDSLPSTNLEAMKRAADGVSEGLVIVADEQTAGRGRLGRHWSSPKGAGLYFSIVLRPQVDAGTWPLITFAAALAVHDALFRCCNLRTDIKWPNDIIVNGRKLCGILAETVESGARASIVLGIGVNLTATSFPPELRETATSIQSATDAVPNPEAILHAILEAFQSRYATLLQDGGREEVIKEWSQNSSFAAGKQIRVKNGHETIEGISRGVERDGALRIETEAGDIRVVRAGDVTVKH
ncbi:MAG TPA: biotin--[acetyl-CoA-carboxylase] ligase [Pyrinomonadaceae bacterium]|nr:biotin--[acetyl-CoA-carboxylase] ligase [Pyrinomonadaceae bacterium]